MIYVTSDLHGCSPERFQSLLNSAGFCDEDFLFVLGDVIDRGAYGAELLLWLTQQPNAQLILGNHEALLLACDFLFDEVTEDSLAQLSVEKMELLENWMQNGGMPTVTGFRSQMKRDPELVEGILDYLRSAPLYETVEVNDQAFILVHSGLGNYRPSRKLSDYAPDELLLARPGLDTRYALGSMVVFGHTPTFCYGSEYTGKAVRSDTWICIDTGASCGYLPMLLRLDDMKEFYL